MINADQEYPQDVACQAIVTKTSTFTGAAVAVGAYMGRGKLTLISAAGTGTSPTMDVKVQHCATSGGSYADVSGATFTQVTDAAAALEGITLDMDALAGYIKIVATIAGTSPSFIYGVALAARKQTE